MRNILSSFIFLVLQFTSINVNAQFRPFDNGEIATIKNKTLQNESYYSTTSQNGLDAHNLLTLMRYGIMDNAELQVSWTGTNLQGGSASPSTTTLGMKLYLTEDRKYMPSFALIGNVNLTADPKNSPFNPSLNLLYEKNIIPNFLVNGNYQVGINEQTGDFSSNFSFNMESEVAKWQNTYIGYLYMGSPSENGTIHQSWIELGMQFWLRDGLSLFPFYDFAISDNASDIINIGVMISLTQ